MKFILETDCNKLIVWPPLFKNNIKIVYGYSINSLFFKTKQTFIFFKEKFPNFS